MLILVIPTQKYIFLNHVDHKQNLSFIKSINNIKQSFEIKIIHKHIKKVNNIKISK